MRYLRQNTTFTVQLGPFLSTADAQTESTALTISSGDVVVSKNGASYVVKDGVGGGTFSGRAYAVGFSSTDANTAGHLRILCNNASALPVWEDFTVLPTQVYDSLIAGSTNLSVESEATSILKNSSHGNAALLNILSSIKSETTAIHVETSAIHSETTLIRGETSSINSIVSNSSHGNAALLAGQGSLQTNILGASGTNIDLSRIAGPTFSTITDSLEALRDRGDAAWITASGFSTLTTSQVPSAAAIATAVHDFTVENTLTHQAIQRILLAGIAGQSTGGGSTTIKFLGVTTTLTRITAGVDANGNRNTITLNGATA